MSDLRVCIVSAVYHLSLGGLGRQAQLLSEKIHEKGVKIFVITRKMKGIPEQDYRKDIEIIRIWTPCANVSVLEEVGIKSLLISLFFSLGCAWNLFKKRNAYEIVHFHGARAALFFNIPVLKLLGKKILAKVSAANHALEAGSLKGNYLFLGNLLAWLVRKVDIFIATSDEIRNSLLHDEITGDKIVRIPNFIDMSKYSAIKDTQKDILKGQFGIEGKIIVTFSGRIVPRKGVEVLLRAWDRITKEFNNAFLLILGSGSSLHEMGKIVSMLKMEESVNFLGWRSDTNDFLNITDIFVLPSLQEGMPNSLLEAMAFGLPCIASRIGGAVDVIEDGISGILFESGNMSELASAMVRLLKDEKLRKRLGEEARKRIEDSFSIDSIANEYVKLYQKLIA
ncbi:MAG: glycosyltransferase family 4 protein [Nitrospirae bacterium]|nr:glycosyltransferase family 4 protein [Nitrospirota bacterium]